MTNWMLKQITESLIFEDVFVGLVSIFLDFPWQSSVKSSHLIENMVYLLLNVKLIYVRPPIVLYITLIYFYFFN